jgi:hypothetical protein
MLHEPSVDARDRLSLVWLRVKNLPVVYPSVFRLVTCGVECPSHSYQPYARWLPILSRSTARFSGTPKIACRSASSSGWANAVRRSIRG